MEMDFDQLIVADRQQAVSLEMLGEIFADFILIQIFSFYQELCIIFKFQHACYHPFCCLLYLTTVRAV